jgi:hypothetical protein
MEIRPATKITLPFAGFYTIEIEFVTELWFFFIRIAQSSPHHAAADDCMSRFV